MTTIIKADDRALRSQAVPFNYEDLSRRAEKYLDQVRQQAARIVAQAAVEAEEVRRKAEQEGRQAAQDSLHKMLDEKVGRQMESLWPALRLAIDGIQQARQEWLSYWERQAIHLAAAMAARVVRRELSRQPEITLSLVREALEMAAGSPQLRLHLNPGDQASLGAQVKSLLAELGRLTPAAEVVADESISLGGCRVETQFGSIDQQFGVQLARLEEELT